jgi:hypothetical protein
MNKLPLSMDFHAIASVNENFVIFKYVELAHLKFLLVILVPKVSRLSV